jgi:hypothetical protein
MPAQKRATPVLHAFAQKSRGIHVFLSRCAKDVDGRHICAKTRFALLPGHDERQINAGTKFTLAER